MDYCKNFLTKYLNVKIIIEENFTEKVDFKDRSPQLQNRLLTPEAKMEKANE